MLQQWKNLSVTLGAVMCGALLTGVVMSWPQRLNQQARAEARVALSAEAEENLKHAEGLSAAFRNVSDSLRPSVVSISAEATPRLASGQGSLPPELRRQLPPWLGDDLLRQFEGQQGGAPRPQQGGRGSGVVIRADGYLLTNNHVVEGAETLKVQLSDGRKLDAKVIGTDPATDLAVLKVDATGLQAAVLGDSEAVQVGDWVVAIGSPFGLDQTVTAGIISGKHRVQGIVGGGNGFEDFLQTDAAINPGNSGGPLVNLQGQVIGINTAIASRTGGNAGVGFAIPSNLASSIMDAILKDGRVQRGRLGALIQDLT
ncbi:MAG: serine protease, partial [Methylococcus sp.]